MLLQSRSKLGSVTMAGVVLRVRLTGGDHIDVTYDEPDTVETDEVIEHVISNLAEDSGVLRSRVPTPSGRHHFASRMMSRLPHGAPSGRPA